MKVELKKAGTKHLYIHQRLVYDEGMYIYTQPLTLGDCTAAEIAVQINHNSGHCLYLWKEYHRSLE